MKLLRELLRDLKIKATVGPMHAAVAGIADNSRHVAKDYLFVAIKGTASDGHQYIEAALAAGACAVVCEVLRQYQLPMIEEICQKHRKITWLGFR